MRPDGLVRGRDGDLYDPPDDSPNPGHSCQRGWAGEDSEGRPIPCPTCRPQTVARLREQQARWHRTDRPAPESQQAEPLTTGDPSALAAETSREAIPMTARPIALTLEPADLDLIAEQLEANATRIRTEAMASAIEIVDEHRRWRKEPGAGIDGRTKALHLVMSLAQVGCIERIAAAARAAAAAHVEEDE